MEYTIGYCRRRHDWPGRPLPLANASTVHVAVAVWCHALILPNFLCLILVIIIIISLQLRWQRINHFCKFLWASCNFIDAFTFSVLCWCVCMTCSLTLSSKTASPACGTHARLQVFNHRFLHAKQTAFRQPETTLWMLLYRYLYGIQSIAGDVLINLA